MRQLYIKNKRNAILLFLNIEIFLIMLVWFYNNGETFMFLQQLLIFIGLVCVLIYTLRKLFKQLERQNKKNITDDVEKF